jgi:hypothetical protein
MSGRGVGGKNLMLQALRLGSLVLLTHLLASTAHAQMPYDGNWDVTVETKAGNCEQVAIFVCPF